MKEWGKEILVAVVCLAIIAWAVWMDNKRAEKERSTLPVHQETRCEVKDYKAILNSMDINRTVAKLCKTEWV